MKKPFAVSNITFLTGILASFMAMNVLAAPITEEKAKSIALENAGYSQDDITFVQTKTDTEDRQLVYEITFASSDYKKYEYEILAEDGTILTIEYDAEPAAKTHNSRRTTISLDRAKEISLTHAGQSKEDVTFTKTETDLDDGRLEYELEFVTGDKKEYKYEINGSTGAVIGWEYDAKNHRLASDQKTAVSDIEAAKAIALKQANVKPEEVTWGHVKTDYDDGRLVYEGEFFHKTLEYEFEIDAARGIITDWDVDSIYD